MFLIKASYSPSIAIFKFGCLKASFTVAGSELTKDCWLSTCVTYWASSNLVLLILLLDLILIGWIFETSNFLLVWVGIEVIVSIEIIACEISSWPLNSLWQRSISSSSTGVMSLSTSQVIGIGGGWIQMLNW